MIEDQFKAFLTGEVDVEKVRMRWFQNIKHSGGKFSAGNFPGPVGGSRTADSHGDNNGERDLANQPI